MEENIKDLLSEEIRESIKELSEFPNDSEEKTSAVNNLVQLYNLSLDETKIEMDFNEKRASRMVEEQFKRDQLSEQVVDRRFRIALEVAGIAVPMIFYAIWMKRGFEFEETGTYTSKTFMGLFNRFRPTSMN